LLTLAMATGHDLSLALFDGEALAGETVIEGMRGQAEALVPAVAALVGDRRADRVLVEVGPGSFTGLRVGIAAARALGLAWGADVRGVSSVAMVAAAVAERPLWVALAAPRGQAWLARVDAEEHAPFVWRVGEASPVREGDAVAGHGAALLAQGRVVHTAPPRARYALACTLLPPSALYVRHVDHVGA
jgi:tRNA threonylcarbamoyl adenosine modification protein YeaZ